MKLELIRDGSGEADLTPNDTFTLSPCCMPISKWLNWYPDDVRSHDGSKIDPPSKYRMELFLRAHQLVCEHSASKDVLRDEPHVVLSYNMLDEIPAHDAIEGFIFKYDNNGNTFKVVCRHKRSDHG